MHIVECPKCTLRFEPDERSSSVFCPQCGELFPAAVAPPAHIANSSSPVLQAAAARNG